MLRPGKLGNLHRAYFFPRADPFARRIRQVPRPFPFPGPVAKSPTEDRRTPRLTNRLRPFGSFHPPDARALSRLSINPTRSFFSALLWDIILQEVKILSISWRKNIGISEISRIRISLAWINFSECNRELRFFDTWDCQAKFVHFACVFVKYYVTMGKWIFCYSRIFIEIETYISIPTNSINFQTPHDVEP